VGDNIPKRRQRTLRIKDLDTGGDFTVQLYVFSGWIGGYRLYEHVEAVESGGGSQASGACVHQAQVTGKLDLCCRGLGRRTCIQTSFELYPEA
jgi:hypothetical protein